MTRRTTPDTWIGAAVCGYENLYHEDWANLPPEEGGAICTVGLHGKRNQNQQRRSGQRKL